VLLLGRYGVVYVVTTTRHSGKKIYRAHLLRRSFRDGRKVRNETVGNLSHLPAHIIDLIRRALHDHALVPASRFEVVRSVPHGDDHAVLIAMERLGFAHTLSSRRCPEADVVTAMVAARVLQPQAALTTTRWWHTRTFAEDLGVRDASEDDLSAAMDWLLDRQAQIETTLASRHLAPGGLVLYDLTSVDVAGTTRPLAGPAPRRDGKRGELQLSCGLVTDGRGCPVAVSVFEGHVSDSATLRPRVNRLREDLGIRDVVLVGDRGMITRKTIDDLSQVDGVRWLTALPRAQIRMLLDAGVLPSDLLDGRSLCELTHPAYPGERLIVGRSPELGELRAHVHRGHHADRRAAPGARLAGTDPVGGHETLPRHPPRLPECFLSSFRIADQSIFATTGRVAHLYSLYPWK